MNFRNDSISSVEPNNFTDLVALKPKTLNQHHPQTQHQTQLQNPNTLQVKQIQPSNVFNIIEDYQFTSSQRSRTISFANQSILTEGIEQQKNIYSMNFKSFNNFYTDIQFKSNEYEFNAYNHHFTKKLQLPLNLMTKLKNDSIALTSMIQNQVILPVPIAQLTEQVLFNEAINNFDYGKEEQFQFPKILRNMPDIQEDVEQEGRFNFDSPRNHNSTNTQKLTVNTKLANETFMRNSNDSFNEKVTNMLLQESVTELDKYSKNLIRFNDEINNVKTERKRKAQGKIKRDDFEPAKVKE